MNLKFNLGVESQLVNQKRQKNFKACRVGVYDYFVDVSRQLSKRQYLLQQYLMGVVVCAAFLYLFYDSLLIARDANPWLALCICAWLVIGTLLFPFSKFTLDSLISYIITGNQFKIPKVIYYIVIFFYLVSCWAYAILIAPIGLLLYVIIKIRKSDRRRDDYYYY